VLRIAGGVLAGLGTFAFYCLLVNVFRVDPTPTEAIEVLEPALTTRAMITIVGHCEVEYDGRASSYLGFGDRLVILKPDDTLLVHTDARPKPINWQPPGCTHRVSAEDDQLCVRSLRSSPTEQVIVTFESVAQLSTFELADESTLALEGSEEDLHQRIFAEPGLIEAGVQAVHTRARDLNRPRRYLYKRPQWNVGDHRVETPPSWS